MPTSNQLLWEAVKSKNIHAARSALAADADPNTFRVPTTSRTKSGKEKITVEFDPITEHDIDHHNDHDHACIREHELHKHNDYVSCMMVAAQNKHIAMLDVLLTSGADVNLAQPQLCYADGYGYGKMTPVCYALNCPKTAQWFVDHGAELDNNIDGLPGYEDIPCPSFTPLLLASEIVKNDAVCRILVEAGADVNHVAQYNNGAQNGDTSVCCYMRTVVASRDVAWAKRLFEEFEAIARWPVDITDAIMEKVVSHPDQHAGFRETLLMTAVHRQDLAMVQLLLEQGAGPRDPEHINFNSDKIEEFIVDRNSTASRAIVREYAEENGLDKDCIGCFENRRSTPLSIALGHANVPPQSLLSDGDLTQIVGVLAPYNTDPILAALLEKGAKCHVAAARRLVTSDEIATILPTYEELVDGVADKSIEMRATYFRIKADHMAQGLEEEEAKTLAHAVIDADPEYDEDSLDPMDTDQDSESESESDYEEEEFERDPNGQVIIEDVVHECA